MFRKRITFAAGILGVAALIAAQAPQADAGPFLRRLFQRFQRPQIYETPQAVPAQPDGPEKITVFPKKETLPIRPGFVTIEAEGRWWIFREGSKDLAVFKKSGEPEKSYTRINVSPYQLTLRAPDVATMEEYLTAKPGFVTKLDDNRLWVFRQGSKEYDFLLKHGELEKHVIRIGAGPRGMTLKAPDAATIDAYLKATAK